METISVNQFRDHLKEYVDDVSFNHDPLMVKRRNGEDFVVISASDWLAEQETLYILQNQSLMTQIAAAIETIKTGQGKKMTKVQQNEIDCI